MSFRFTLYESHPVENRRQRRAAAVIMAHLENCAVSTGGRKRKGTQTHIARPCSFNLGFRIGPQKLHLFKIHPMSCS